MLKNNQLSDEERHLLSFIDEDEIIHFLQALIQARSDAPPGDCRSAVSLVAEKLSSAGVSTEVLALREHQPNLLASIPGSCNAKRLLFHSHIDTVPSGDMARWSVDLYEGIFSDGRIIGRGAGDDKGSVAAQVMALAALARSGVPLPGCLKLAVVSDEETGGLYGTRWLRDQGRLGADALLVGEQTNNSIAIAERVACGIDLTVYGKSAHGAMPWAGDNAILKMSRLLTWLEKHYLPEMNVKHHPFLPPATLNFGRISGGIQWSIVPEICKVEMDRRLLPHETRETAMEELRRVIQDFADNNGPFDFELFSEGDVAANINTSPHEPFVRLAHQLLGEIRGETSELTGYPQTSDGRWFAEDGIPIIIFGPGDPALAHAANEYVPAAQVIEAAQFLAVLALRWGSIDAFITQ